MRKTLLLVVMSLLGFLLPQDITAVQAQPLLKADASAPSFYAVTCSPTYGISKFSASSDPLSLSEVYSDNDYGYISENVYAVYGNGRLFLFQPRINSQTYEIWKLRFITYKLDGDTWSYENNVELTPSYNNYPHEMTFDPQTNTLYGLRSGLSGTDIYTIDQSTGSMTYQKSFNTYFNMVVTDAYGESYATDWDGNFYTVDLSTAEYTLVGSTGISSDDALVGIVDPVTNKIYQNLSKYGKYTLYEIDKTSGKATKVGDYADGVNVRGLAPVAATTPGGGDDNPVAFKLYGLQYSPQQSLVSFDPATPGTTTTEFEDGTTGVTYFRQGAVSAFDGKNLYIYTPKTSDWGLSSLKYSVYTLDGTEWKITKELSLEADYSKYPNRMAYDPATGEIYGYRNGSPSAIYKIDRETGAMTWVCNMNGFLQSLAFDKDGNGFGFDFDSNLNKLNLSDGSLTTVGATGQSIGDQQPTYINAQTNTLYWVSNSTQQAKLYTVDLATGAASEVGEMPSDTKYFGIFGIGSAVAADKQAPDVCQDLTVSYATPGSLTATVTATAPVLAFDKQTSLVGKVAVKFYADDSTEPFKTVENVAAGGQATAEYTFADAGNHKVKAVAANDNGDGPAKTVYTFAGFDQPKAPQNITLDIASNGKYTLTWDAPTEGINGGAIDNNNIKYVVTQYPSKQVTETTENRVTGTIENKAFAAYQFGVKAVCGDQTGEEGFSNSATYGDYAEVPYYDDFKDANTFGTYTIANVNEDDATWEVKKANTGDMAAIYDGSQCNATADDYFVLPPMKIAKGATYTVTFNAASAFGQDYGNHIDVVLLKNPADIAAGKVKIGSFENIPDYTGGISEKTFDYTATEDGVAYFAFYCRSTAKRKVTIYDIQITGRDFANAPADVSDLKAVAGSNGAHTVSISFKAPLKDAQNNDLAKINHIKVYRDGGKSAVKTFADVAPGETCEYLDEDVTAGKHTYTVLAITEDGASNGSNAYVFVGQGIPATPTDFNVKEEEDCFVLTWTAPTTSTDGNYIDFDHLKYAVYYQYGLMENPSLLNGEVSGCELRVPKSMFDDYASAHQILISFMLMAQTENGYSDVQTTDIVYGPDYELPFKESFENGYALSEPWGVLSVSDVYANSWFMIAGNNSSKPMEVDPQDGDNGMAMFYQNEVNGYESRLLTPRVTTGTAQHPILSFYVYHYNTSGAQNSSVQVELKFTDNDDFVAVGEPISVFGENGWQQHKINLADVEDNEYRIVFRAKADKMQPIFIDNIVLEDDITSAIQNLNASQANVAAGKGCITISTGAQYAIYTADGTQVAGGKSEGEKLNLAPGVYIVKVNGTTTKQVVR